MKYGFARNYWPAADRFARGATFFLIGSLLLIISKAAPLYAANNTVYQVSSFPIAAQAKNAVTAKKLAMDDGQIRAFRSLLKRIVPVGSYSRLPKLKLSHVQDMIEGFSVKKEQNSRTEYLATLDFTFRKNNVRQLLKSYGLPFVDVQAPKILVVPHYLGSWPEEGTGEGGTGEEALLGEDPSNAQLTSTTAEPDARALKSRQRDWFRAWRDLDLKHALVPVKLKPMHEKVHADTIRDLVTGKKNDALKIVLNEYQIEHILVALAGRRKDGRLAVRFVGADRVGQFSLNRVYRVYDNDFLYTAELASIIGLGVLEGRWKSVKAQKVKTAPQQQWNTQEAIRVEVEYSGLYEWQQIRKKLSQMSNIDDLKIGRISARGADISLSHSGNIASLQSLFLARGLILEDRGGQYNLRNR